MITIRMVAPPGTAQLFFANANGHVFFDLPGGLELRTTQSLDRIGPLGRITQEAALSVSLVPTAKNKTMLAGYHPDSLGRLKGKFAVEVYNAGERVDLTACLVLRYSEAEGYEVELFGGDWVEDTDLVKGKDLELTPFLWTRENVIAAWGTGRSKPEVLPGLAHYGGWNQGGQIVMRDLRFWFNAGDLLREIFCAAGWSFQSPHLDQGDGRWWYLYLSGEYWHTYSGKQADGYQEFLAGGQAVPPYDRSGDPPRTSTAPSPNVDWTNMGAPSDRARVQYEFEGDGEEVLTTHITIEVQATVVLPPPEGTEVPQFSVVIYQNNFRSIMYTEIYREQYSGGELSPRTLTVDISQFFEIQVNPSPSRTSDEIFYVTNFEVWLIYEDSQGEREFQLTEAEVRFRPDPRYYVNGDTIRPGEVINPKLTGKDIIEAVAHLTNAKFTTDYGRKQVTLHVPFDYTRTEDNAPIRGFFRRSEAPIDMTDRAVPGSLAWDDEQAQRNRFRLYDFQEGDDAYIDQVGGRSRFGRTVDLGDGAASTDELRNPLFEPTAMVVVPKEQTTPIVVSPTLAREIIVPALWDNQDGEISHDLGPRICVWYGLVEQGDPDAPNRFYFEGDLVELVPVLAMLPGDSLPPETDVEPLTFSGYRNDLWNRFYRQEVREETGPPIEVQLAGGDETYRLIDFRRTILIRSETGVYELQPVAKRDHVTGSDVPLLVEGRNLSC